VAAFLVKGFPSRRMLWMMKYRCRISIVSDQSTGFIETKYFDGEDNELI
jgi:ribonuclease G